jgi:hypothetical protein
MEGSSHSYHLALHCLGVFLTSKDDIRAHCYTVSQVHWFDLRVLTFFPYFEMAAFKISSSVCCQLRLGVGRSMQLTCVTPDTTFNDDSDLFQVSWALWNS